MSEMIPLVKTIFSTKPEKIMNIQVIIIFITFWGKTSTSDTTSRIVRIFGQSNHFFDIVDFPQKWQFRFFRDLRKIRRGARL